MRRITDIIVHCSATPENRDVTIEEIDKWHKEKGFYKIGYHYVIYLDGSIHKGREEYEIGAHCIHHNLHSLGVCYVGGVDNMGHPKDTRTPAQKKSLILLLKDLKRTYPKANIYGHNDFANKDCPCFNAHAEYLWL